MVVRKNKKCVKRRGHTTHGYGSMKKNRGAGNRGGRGMAGTGKRGDAKKPSIDVRRYFGKRGFFNPNVKIKVSINVQDLKKLSSKKEGEFIVIDLKEKGFNKLLSKGRADQKYKIIVDYATPKAIEKIKALGGEVIFPEKQE